MAVMGIILTVLVSLYRQFSVFKSTQDEATMLRDALLFSRSTAIRSNDIIYVAFDLDEEKYHSYRKVREQDEIKEKEVIKERSLSAANSLVAVQVGSSNRQDRGKLVVKMYPDGSSDELMIFLGPGPGADIKYTVLFSRYGKAEAAKGEKEPAREDSTYKENLEDWQ
ncbi:MAG TPA: hypothetical protein PKN93_17060 [Leptospiraceae bacterium]|nr:hypothetical protein [Leptospiraceae bacterium]HNN76364.1 hypothetical protein [Leptospiraceae bacterium]